jgi:hypothetical protein
MGKPLTRRPVAGHESDSPQYVATIVHACLAATVCEHFSGNTVTLTPTTPEVVVPIPRSLSPSQGRSPLLGCLVQRSRPSVNVILKGTFEEAGLPADGILGASYFQLPG